MLFRSKQKTAYEIVYRDWSSDVCSSDLCPMCYTEDSYDEDYGYDYWDVDKTVDDGFCHCGEKVDAEVHNDA